MNISSICVLMEEFRNPKNPKSEQIYGDLEVAHDVQDLLDYAKQNQRVVSIPLKILIRNTPPFTLPGDSDEPDGSVDFRNRTSGLTLRDYTEGKKFPPILVMKQKSGEYMVADGRHRVVNFVNLLRKANKNPLNFSIKGYVLDEQLLQTKLPSKANKYDSQINQMEEI